MKGRKKARLSLTLDGSTFIYSEERLLLTCVNDQCLQKKLGCKPLGGSDDIVP